MNCIPHLQHIFGDALAPLRQPAWPASPPVQTAAGPVVRDGEILRVNMMLLDEQQKEVAAAFNHNWNTDEMRNPYEVTDEMRQQVEDARDQSIADASNAWLPAHRQQERQPVRQRTGVWAWWLEPDLLQLDQQQRQEQQQRLQQQEELRRHEIQSRPAPLQQQQQHDRRAAEPTAADTAYLAMVQDLENSWRR